MPSTRVGKKIQKIFYTKTNGLATQDLYIGIHNHTRLWGFGNLVGGIAYGFEIGRSSTLGQNYWERIEKYG